MPAFNFARRSESSSDSDSASLSNPVYLAGIIVVAVIVLGLSIWLGLRYYRKRVASKRESQMGAAFLSVRGLVKDNGSIDEKSYQLHRSHTQNQGAFSRDAIDSSVVLPARARLPSAAPREEIIEQYRQSGTFPAPFAAKPFQFALGVSPRASMLESETRTHSRTGSFLSFQSQNRYSVMSTTSSFDPSTTTGTMRKVRQLFDPVLPDELVTRLGEHLTVVQSFDDGWCVVGRDTGSLVTTAKSLFKPVSETNVEIGIVPAWCFLKPVKGLRAERPIRSSSLGITVNLDAPGFSSRNELVSWSNF